MSYDYTHHVQRWLNNNDEAYEEARTLAAEALMQVCNNESHAPSARIDAQEVLAEDLRTVVEHGMPALEGLWADMLRSAIGEIEYELIAESFLKELPIWAVFSSDAEEARLYMCKGEALGYLESMLDDDNTMHAGPFKDLANLADNEKQGPVSIDGTTYHLVKS